MMFKKIKPKATLDVFKIFIIDRSLVHKMKIFAKEIVGEDWTKIVVAYALSSNNALDGNVRQRPDSVLVDNLHL